MIIMYSDNSITASTPNPWCDPDAITILAVVTPAATCEQCDQPFQPRARGGSKQRFCSTKCRTAFHNSQRVNETPQRISETAETLETPRTIAPVPAPKVQDDPNKFDWLRDHELVVVRQQSAIAVYTNGNDDVVIRQEGQYGYDDDVWILVSRQNLAPLIRRLQRLERGEE
jgi:hypothetical protein